MSGLAKTDKKLNLVTIEMFIITVHFWIHHIESFSGISNLYLMTSVHMMIIAIVGPYHDHLPEVEEEGSSNHQEYVSMICIKLN